MIECLLEALIDTLKVIPFLFLTFIVLEYIEHKFTDKNKKMLSKNKKYGPAIGGVLGAIPQCGFGTVAANLFSARVITMGTLIAVFLSTSDEMLPIMISEQANILLILKIIGFKLIVGIIIGYIIDLIYRKNQEKAEIHEFCEHEHCDCEHDGILLSSIKHTIKIGLFILLANIIIGLLIFYIGEDKISSLLLHHNILTYLLSSLVGLIPNCAGSVIITELFLSNMISVGTLLAGLLTGSGIGILVLFRVNKNLKENLTILGILYFIGVVIGILVDFII
ncbi:MAG: arsenic efflux protein [Bacilli bacterium]|nr:arsenic efflux protein [Bacilli bacterium]